MINFLGAEINVSQKVFEPRPETKYWVKKFLKDLKTFSQKGPIKILDIFAGSGCIGISILKNNHRTFVDFSDIDENALKQIQINLCLNRIKKERFNIFKSDVFENLEKTKWDFILANPPYVALKRIAEVQKDVLEKDPYIALFGGEDGMFYIKKFLNQAKNYLKKNGKIYMEFDPFQKKEIEKILTKNKYQYNFKKDQFKKIRYLIAEKI